LQRLRRFALVLAALACLFKDVEVMDAFVLSRPTPSQKCRQSGKKFRTQEA